MRLARSSVCEGEHPLHVPGQDNQDPLAFGVLRTRRENCQDPNTDFIARNTGSGVCLCRTHIRRRSGNAGGRK